ncbi:acyl-CoA dehydrogenase [Mycolicibacterium moriokaense]|nr:acyl-CoA dehydrogenase [Mycolicibacterium moriokaense]
MLCATSEELDALRSEIRAFLVQDRAQYGWQSRVDSWLSSWDEGFSARLGGAGFLGLTVPVEYGGRGLGHLHRYVVTEELLMHGAPVAAHWFADRQFAPALLAYGTQAQRESLLPEISAGRCYVAIGMSEDGAGSDLAGVRTRATRADGGWLLGGRKLWTSGAHRAAWIVVLARTGAVDPENRRAGLSQFLVPADARGVSISPIRQMSGEHHFNEVEFSDVFVPDADVLGEIGSGWTQVTAELSFERSGPERILTTAPLVDGVVGELSTRHVDSHTQIQVGHLLAQLISLRQLSVSVAHTLCAGDPAANHAALVKDLGTGYEQHSVEACAELLELAAPPSQSGVAEMLAEARLHAPMFTLRGGTNEVLRGLVARGMGLR